MSDALPPARTVQASGDVVLFGPDSPARLPAELAARSARRVLIVTSDRWSARAAELGRALGDRHAGVFTEVAPQVPEPVAQAVVQAADDSGCDWVLAVGGGSAVGAAKVVALDRPGVQLAAVPTTYAGSERTDIWGRSRDGHKTTGRDERVRPRLVAYDPALPAGMPRRLRLHSLLNALAHSVEALYAAAATPAAQQAARASLAPLWRALSEQSGSEDRASDALYGAWQASEALGGASMGLHHKLAHVLGGHFGTPHAPTHATLLPHTLGFNLPAAPDLRASLQEAWQVASPAAALFDRMRQQGLSVALADLGISAENTATAAELATRRPYPNPRPLDRDALAALLERARTGQRPTAGAPGAPMTTHPDDITRVSHPGDGLDYLTGYGNHLRSEAVPGSVPDRINGPRHPPHGLFPELINGTGFTFARAHNLRTWTYRLRPAVTHRPFTPMEPGTDSPPPPHFVSDFSTALHSPAPQRYRPVPLPENTAAHDLLDGIDTFAGAGSPTLGQGLAIHLWTAFRDMERIFVNIDGDLLLAPETGRLRIRTELGWLDVAPGEIVLLPRGLRFQVFLPAGPAKGFAAELYDGHFQLPERGVVGSNGLADERHFKAPVASYENRVEDTVVVVKQGGRFWRLVSPHSPFDVVGWHGRYAPFKYDLRDFMSMGSVSFDHPDPSILTVLTHPLAEGGKNAVDVGVFAGRWEPTEQTFRPPFHHRNSAIEFNMVLQSPPTKGGYPQGAFSFTPLLTPHGLGSHAHHHHTFEVDDTPNRITGDSLWLQFESAYQLGVLPRWLSGDLRDTGFLEQFQGYTLGPLAQTPR